MSHRESLGFLTAATLVAAVAASCSSSSSGAGGGGGDDASIIHKDAEVIIGNGDASAEAGPAADGTTGKACKTDADCVTATGPGINRCSSSLPITFTKVTAQLFPTPVCVIPLTAPGNCDPAPLNDPTGMFIHYCDGPDLPTSPGVCLSLTTPPAPGQGSCEPKCSFPLDGSAPTGSTGCAGNNTCVAQFTMSDSTGTVTGGGGFCQGSCEQDTDCSALGAGYVCQTDIALCTKLKVVRKKAIGQACTVTARVNDLTSGACNCQLAGASATGAGYCTSSCIVGGTVPCPNGWICDNQQSLALSDGTTLTVENVKTAGLCFAPCSLGSDAGGAPVEAAAPPADGGSDASPADAGPSVEAAAPLTCPVNSTCQLLTPAGPNCVP